MGSATFLWAESSWPEYRGPHANGHSDATALPLQWSEQAHVKWKTAIHGKAWSTPLVLGDRIWLTTATEDGTELCVMCLDRADGRIVLDRKLFDVPNPQPLGNDLNSYGSPSPVAEPGRVYVHFGTYGHLAEPPNPPAGADRVDSFRRFAD